MAAWLETAPGRYLVEWEHEQLDRAVTDAFGFHALQLGLPGIDALRANRMPHRWIADDSLVARAVVPRPPGPDEEAATAAAGALPGLYCDFAALPFPNASIDLVVLPHTLELAREPHLTLREVERVLVPEGRLVVAGFNPASLWGARQRAGRLGRSGGPFVPGASEFIGYRRLRDWLRLLGFEVEGARFGGYRPPVRSARWLERCAWMDHVGAHWWPVLGAVYFVAAVKRVRGMRLVGLLRNERRAPKAAPAVVANREPAEIDA